MTDVIEKSRIEDIALLAHVDIDERSDDFVEQLQVWESLNILPYARDFEKYLSAEDVNRLLRKLKMAHQFKNDNSPNIVNIRDQLSQEFQLKMMGLSDGEIAAWEINVYHWLSEAMERGNHHKKNMKQAVSNLGFQELGRLRLQIKEHENSGARFALSLPKHLPDIQALNTGRKNIGELQKPIKQHSKFTLARPEFFNCEDLATTERLENKTLAALGRYVEKHGMYKKGIIKSLVKEDVNRTYTEAQITTERLSLRQVLGMAFPETLKTIDEIFSEMSDEDQFQVLTPQNVEDAKNYFVGRIVADFIAMLNPNNNFKQDIYRTINRKPGPTTEMDLERLTAHAKIADVLTNQFVKREIKKLKYPDLWAALLRDFKINQAAAGNHGAKFYFQRTEKIGFLAMGVEKILQENAPKEEISNRQRIAQEQWGVVSRRSALESALRAQGS